LFLTAFALLLQTIPAGDQTAAETPPEGPAETAAPDPSIVDPVPADQAPAPGPAPLILPKAHPIVIAIDKELGSKISQTGEVFPIRLAQPVVIEGVEVLPEGIVGEGQVVHAKKAGIGGAAGELILAARYLDHGGRRIELRSFRFLEAGDNALAKGQDNIGAVNATMALASPLAIFIGGGNTNVPPGTIASAKIRNDEAFDRPAATPANTEVQSEEGSE
jgi:hypothetical protein